MSGMLRLLTVCGASLAMFVAASLSAAAPGTEPQAAPPGSPPGATPELVKRLADAIRSGRGKPTAFGQAILDAEQTGDYVAVGTRLAAGAQRVRGPSAGALMLATDAQGAPGAPAAPSDAGTDAAAGPDRSARAEPSRRVLGPRCITALDLLRSSGPRRALGWSGYYDFWCGGGVRANIVWYCRQGSLECNTRWTFSDGQVVTARAGSCSIVLRAPCQVYSWTQSGDPWDWAQWARLYQTVIGAPVATERWCG